jgi:hypothetical protein
MNSNSTSNSNSTIFEIAKDIKYNFTSTNKNIFIPNLSLEEIKDVINYLESKKYNINKTIIDEYYDSNESRYIFPENKWYPIQIMDSRYIKYSDLDPKFTKDLVDRKYKYILINPYKNYLIVTNENGDPVRIILQSAKDKTIIDCENLKTAYYQFSLEKNRIVSVQRLKAMMFVMNPDITTKVTVGHKDRNRWNNNIDNHEWQTQFENNNEKEV